MKFISYIRKYIIFKDKNPNYEGMNAFILLKSS